MTTEPPLGLRRILTLWWPLAGSWVLMGVEMPMVTAVVARLPDERVQLAAIGAVVYPVSILIEAPIIMLLAASTRLSADYATWRRLWWFAHIAGGGLALLHAAIAFTPLFDLLVCRLIDVPERVVEPARLGLQIMTPWSWAIAWRRFQQGALIRVERSRQVALGTGVRLGTNAVVLAGGYALAVARGGGAVSGVLVGAVAIVAGVVTEAVFAERGARRLVAPALAKLAPAAEPWSWRAFLRFYLPLSCTPLISIALQPIGAAAMSRLPQRLESMAAWPVVYGLVFVFRSLGLAYNEVVVAMSARPDAERALGVFAQRLAIAATAALAVFAVPAIGYAWYRGVAGLDPELARFATVAVAIALPMPFYSVLQNLYQGRLVHARRTAPITRAVVVYALISAALLLTAVMLTAVGRVDVAGIRVVLGAFLVAGTLQTLYLRAAARKVGGAEGPASREPRPGAAE
ncbi:MAG: hypothetical protein IPM29_00380 [Planctomycetes bacterium]|nr:hypothetical protein [Planctomycetota bacterium]